MVWVRRGSLLALALSRLPCPTDVDNKNSANIPKLIVILGLTSCAIDFGGGDARSSCLRVCLSVFVFSYTQRNRSKKKNMPTTSIRMEDSRH